MRNKNRRTSLIKPALEVVDTRFTKLTVNAEAVIETLEESFNIAGGVSAGVNALGKYEQNIEGITLAVGTELIPGQDFFSKVKVTSGSVVGSGFVNPPLGYMSRFAAAGGVMPDAHALATETMINSLKSASRNYYDECWEIQPFFGNTAATGLLTLKGEYPLVSELGTYNADSFFTSAGFTSTGVDSLQLTIPELASEYLQGYGMNFGSLTSIGSPHFLDPNGSVLWLQAGPLAIISKVNGAQAGAGPVVGSLGFSSLHNRSLTNVEYFDDGVSKVNTADAASTYTGVLKFGGESGSYTTESWKIAYQNKVEWSDAEVAEFEGILQTWLTAVGR